VVKNVYHYDTHTTNGCPLFIKRQKAESSFWLHALSQDPTGARGLHCQTPVIGLRSPTGPLFIKFANPPLALLCLVTCWCSDIVNLVVAMELSTDIKETHENQDSRKISISRIIFLALENWTVWIGRNKQLLVLVSDSRSTIGGSNQVEWGGGGLSPAEQEWSASWTVRSSWSGFKSNVSESAVRVLTPILSSVEQMDPSTCPSPLV